MKQHECYARYFTLTRRLPARKNACTRQATSPRLVSNWTVADTSPRSRSHPFHRHLRRIGDIVEKLKRAQIACIAFLFCAAVAISAPAQTLTTLVSFDGTNGAYPDYPGSLPIQGPNGNFYGTTAVFGANNEGTLFMMTPAGKLTTLYNFCSQASCLDGAIPLSPNLSFSCSQPGQQLPIHTGQ